MTNNRKFSELIIDLTEIWLHWVKNNSTCRDKTQSISARKKAADECEHLIKREYQIVSELDAYFK